MSTEHARKVVSRAVIDATFRNLLFSDPEKALAGYDLTEEESQALRSIPSETMDDFSSKLEERISMSLIAFGTDLFGADRGLSGADPSPDRLMGADPAPDRGLSGADPSPDRLMGADPAPDRGLSGADPSPDRGLSGADPGQGGDARS